MNGSVGCTVLLREEKSCVWAGPAWDVGLLARLYY